VATDRLTAQKLVAELSERGIKLLCVGPSRLRMVTHYGISSEDIDLALAGLAEIMANV